MVISGGIDLSVGSVMALASVTSAVLMKDQGDAVGVGVVVGVLLLGLAVGAINGGLIVVTRVPDIVVTLAMSFVWAGAALLILNTPGGGAAPWLMAIISGPLGSEWLPKALIVLVVVVAVVWIPLRRSTLGLTLYAVGSSPLAAFRSGVAVGRTKVVAYALTGFFSALGGLALTASGGVGAPVPGSYTLQSVAAIVLGGVSLAGGRGGVVGPDHRGRRPRPGPDRPDVHRRRPQPVDGDPGRDPDRRGDVRQPRGDAEGAAMTGTGAGSGRPPASAPRSPGLTAGGWRRVIRDQPLIPLVILLVVLIAVLELAKPGTVNGNWAATTLRAAIPLAILAACQTLAMLTGGIDLSVGAVASMAAFLMATQATAQGPVVAIVIAFVAAAIAGIVNGIGIGVFKVHPADHDPRHEPGRARPDVGVPARHGPVRHPHPGRHRSGWDRGSRWASSRTASSCSCRSRS